MKSPLSLIDLKQLKAIRESFEWSQDTVSEKSGISRKYISDLETGAVNNPSIGILSKFAEVFGYEDVNALLTRLSRVK